MSMTTKNIRLPKSVILILEGVARRKGQNVSSLCRERIVQHMLATEEMFICSRCGGYVPGQGMSDKQDVCVPCRSLG